MHIQEPLFSIIIPTYNRSQLLSIAIQSVINQTFKNWELIVIDDGATDETKMVVQTFQKDERIRYFFEEHQERSTARNRGIEEAIGKYICFLDDDDYYLKNHLFAFFEELREHNFPEIILRTGFIRRKGELYLKSTQYIKSRDKNPVRFATFHFCSVCTLCIPSIFFRDIKFPSRFQYWEDTYTILQLFAQYKFKQLQIFTYIYVHHQDRSSKIIYQKNNARELIENNIQAIDDFFTSYPQISEAFLPTGAKKWLISNKYIDHANGALKHQKIILSLHLIIAAMSNYNIFPFLIKYMKFALKLPIYLLSSLLNQERFCE